MSFKSIIGQPLAVTLVQRWLGKQTTQPLLFYGPEGVGKRLVALEAAKALNCQQMPGVAACDTCLPCKKIAAGRHADVRVIDLAYQAMVRGEPLEKQQSLKIETILEERKRLYQTANEGLWKVSIIDDAHRFTADAANVLLKVLEEPPPRTAIFLLTPFRDRIFSTLLSRCQPVRFRQPTDKEMPKPLTHEQIQARSEAEAFWKKLPSLTPGQILAKQGPRSRSSTVTRFDMEAQLQVLLIPATQELRGGRPGSAAKVELIQRAQQQLRQNVPPALVYDHLLIKLSKS